jgi:hypothetical protein
MLLITMRGIILRITTFLLSFAVGIGSILILEQWNQYKFSTVRKVLSPLILVGSDIDHPYLELPHSLLSSHNPLIFEPTRRYIFHSKFEYVDDQFINLTENIKANGFKIIGGVIIKHVIGETECFIAFQDKNYTWFIMNSAYYEKIHRIKLKNKCEGEDLILTLAQTIKIMEQ